MAEKIIFTKRKKIKTWLRKAMLCTLVSYLSFISAVGIAILTMALCRVPVAAFEIAVCVLAAVVLAASLVIAFAVIPLCRVKQAKLDLQNLDFTPYTAKDVEVYVYSEPREKYYFTPAPFDDDEGTVELSGDEALSDYFEQFSPDRLRRMDALGVKGDFCPFCFFDFKHQLFTYTVEKRREGDYITVTLTENYRLTFEEDGVHIGDRVFAYEEIDAFVSAGFIQRYARFTVQLNMVLSEEFAASFAFGTRIMSIADKHKIAIQARPIADCILHDPQAALKRIALRGRLKLK